MKNSIIIFLILAFIGVSCDEILEYDTVNIPVVEGYLYEGRSIENLKISNVINYGSNELLEFREITNIHIEVDGNIFLLEEIERDSVISFSSDNSLIITAGKEYTLNFNYGDELIKATTEALSKPEGLSMSKTNIYLDRLDGTTLPSMEFETIEVLWDNPDDEYFYLVIQYLEEIADPVRSDMDREPEDMIIEPMISDAFNINSRMIVFFGTYRLILFKVTQDYANMFERIENNSQSLTEPYTNIDNGKGIFTSIAADTIYYEVRAN